MPAEVLKIAISVRRRGGQGVEAHAVDVPAGSGGVLGMRAVAWWERGQFDEQFAMILSDLYDARAVGGKGIREDAT